MINYCLNIKVRKVKNQNFRELKDIFKKNDKMQFENFKKLEILVKINLIKNHIFYLHIKCKKLILQTFKIENFHSFLGL